MINRIREDNPRVWTKSFEEETIQHINKAMELEIQYAKDVLPNGILGLNSEMFIEYMSFIANRRLTNLGIESPYKDSKNPFSCH